MEDLDNDNCGFNTPPRDSKKEWSSDIVTDMPLELIENYNNKVKRDKGDGYLFDYIHILDSKYIVPTHKYDGKKWTKWDIQNENIIDDSVTSLSFYTQNVWFSWK